MATDTVARTGSLAGAKPVYVETVCRERWALRDCHRRYTAREVRIGVLLRQVERERRAQSRELARIFVLAERVLGTAESHYAEVKRCGATSLCRKYQEVDPTCAELAVEAVELMGASRRRAREARARRMARGGRRWHSTFSAGVR